MFGEWINRHEEKSGRGRGLTHLMRGPWLFEGEEVFPELGGMKQLVQIGEFEEFGRGLVIDGMTQLAEAIDPVYTSALIFPAATAALSRKRWLIAGGGDGPAVREALAFRSTEHVKLVDISRMVMEKTRELIPSFWGGCQSDSRLEVVPRDVFAVMREMVGRGEKADIIISDLTDPGDSEYTPFSDSSSDRLYTEEGMRLFASCLSPVGIFAMQAQELSLLRWENHMRLYRLLKKFFYNVRSYRIFIEFFGYWESFLIAGGSADYYSGKGRVSRHANDLWSAGYEGTLADYWDNEVKASLFAIPPKLYELAKLSS